MENANKSNMAYTRLLPFDPIVLARDAARRWLVIVLAGHLLNVAMALMSVLVHGIRLNTLEFSGHIGVEWGGRPYRPFR